MTHPYWLCALAVAAAALAAYIGHLMSPTLRARRAQRRRREALQRHRVTIAGQLAIRPELWIEFWYEQELDSLQDASRWWHHMLRPTSTSGGA